MKKKVLIIAGIVIAILAIVVCVVMSNPTENIKVEGVDLSTEAGAEAFINKIYEPLADQMPNLMTSPIDLTSVDSLTYYTGLTDTQGIEYAVASEPMMSSQAYSLVLVKVSEGTDVEKVKQDIFDKVDTRKWICVEAENKYATDYDNTVIFLMSAKDWAVPVYNRISEILGDAKGNELKFESETNMNEFETGDNMPAYSGEE